MKRFAPGLILFFLILPVSLMGQPGWWDNPGGVYTQHRQAVFEGAAENELISGVGAQAQYVDVTLDVENDYNQSLTKSIWIQIEWSVEYIGSGGGSASGGLMTGATPHQIFYPNNPDACPANPLDDYPADHVSGDLIEEGPFTPEHGFNEGFELSYDGIQPQPPCERFLLHFFVGPDSRLTYRVEVQTVCIDENVDFGDAPDGLNIAGIPDYPTLRINSGAHHSIIPDLHMGSLIDPETDGQPDLPATGDDLATSDDEDGIAAADLTWMVTESPQINVSITVPGNTTAFLNGWIDYDMPLDGWQADEMASTTYTNADPNPVTTTVTLNFPAIPVDNVGFTYARFRLCTDDAPINTPEGSAPNGEVEDYRMTFTELIQEFDFGDAPDGLNLPGVPDYPTLLSNMGANHIIVPYLHMGAAIDGEADGQPNQPATGDDLAATDDEDGVAVADLTWMETESPQIDVTITIPGNTTAFLNGWIDYDMPLDGWQADEMASTTYTNADPNPVTTTVTLNFPQIPAGTFGTTYARFRLCTDDSPIATPADAAPNGEVEDYQMTIRQFDQGMDFGDAPEHLFPQFPTYESSDGARHVVVQNIFLGSLIDSEVNGIPHAAAEGDDNDQLDDEDGVVFDNLPLIQGQQANLTVTASVSGNLSAWIDLNGDGDWDDPDENIFLNEPLNPGANALSFMVPVNEPTNVSAFSRFRFSTQQIPDYRGLIADGEVEDYLIEVLYPIELTSFTANYIEDAVKLEWTTESETDNYGFRVYRAERENGDYKEITQQIIPGAGNSQTTQNYSFVDEQIHAGTSYYYKLADISYSGRVTLHDPISVEITPRNYILEQNFPNPFNPDTRIQFQLKKNQSVKLSVFNLRGQMVRKLVEKEMNSGIHSVTWDGKDNNGNTMPSGVYLYKLRVNGFEETKRMELLK